MTNVVRIFALLTLVIAASFSPRISVAHETPVALLEVRETLGGDYVVEWNFSSSRNLGTPSAVFPAHCSYNAPRLDCGEQGLLGPLAVERLGMSYSAVVVSVLRQGQSAQSYTLTGAQPSITLQGDGEMPALLVASAYIPLGIEHIALGIDHLLFVLGLLLLVRGIAMLVKTITAFTIAHSLTLAAATFGWIGVPESSVNAAIALSIAVVAAEVILERRGQPTWSARFPWAVAFGFGLLHGLGFASALTDIGLPESSIPLALLFFNVGVEIGQLGFVFIVLALIASHRQLRAELPSWSAAGGMYLLGTIASFWFLSRFFALLARAA